MVGEKEADGPGVKDGMDAGGYGEALDAVVVLAEGETVEGCLEGTEK